MTDWPGAAGCQPSCPRWRPGLLLLLLLLGLLPLPALARAPAGSHQLLSLRGEVRVDGSPARTGSLAAGAWLVLGLEATAQLLLGAGAGAEAMAVSLRGPARVRLGPELLVQVAQAARLRASGRGRLQLPASREVELADASVILDGASLYVTEGRARLLPPPSPAASQPVPVELAAGQRIELPGRAEPAAGAPTPEMVQELSRFSVAPWQPTLPRVTAADVRQAEQFTGEQRRAERETASCGCSEGSGSGSAPGLGTGPGLTPLERQNAHLRVRVIGVPRAN